MKYIFIILISLLLCCTKNYYTTEPVETYDQYRIGDVWDMLFKQTKSGYSVIGYTTRDSTGIFRYTWIDYVPSHWSIDTLTIFNN